jgi:hypothetical protein
VAMAMKIRAFSKAGSYLTTWENRSFSRTPSDTES